MHPEGPVFRPAGRVDHGVGDTYIPHAVITSLVGERRGLLPEEIAPRRVSCEPEVVRTSDGTRFARAEVSATRQMICVTVEISDDPVTRRVRATAPSIRRALPLAGSGRPGRDGRVVFPIDPEAFFGSGGSLRQARAVAGSPEIFVRGRVAATTRPASTTLGRDSHKGQGGEHPPFDEAGARQRREPPLLASAQGATSWSDF